MNAQSQKENASGHDKSSTKRSGIRAEVGQRRRAITRAKIIAAAFEVFCCEEGVFKTIDAVYKKAGISRSTFYSYFKNMPELYAAISEELTHSHIQGVLTVEDHTEDLAEQLIIAIKLYFNKAMRDPNWGWGLINISASGSIFGAESYALVRENLQAGIDNGRYQLANADVGRDLVSGIAFSTMNTLLRKGQSVQYLNEVYEHLLLALGLKGPEAKRLAQMELPDKYLSNR